MATAMTPNIWITGCSSCSHDVVLSYSKLDKAPSTTATCLEIPISYIITPTPPATLPQSIADLPISVAYTYNLHHFHCLRPKHRQECIVYPTLSCNVQALVSDPDTTVSSFFTHAFTAPSSGTFISPSPTTIFDHTFINVHPFLLSLGLVPRSSDPSRLKLTMKIYCQQCSHLSSAPVSVPPPKIPHKSLLHRFIPASNPSPACPICFDPLESLEHFFFSCPLKLPIWHYVWSTYINSSQTPVTLPSLQLALTSLVLPDNSCPNAMFAIAAALEAIWRSHWAFIFNDTPFHASQVESLIDKLFLKARQESFLCSDIPHAPLPFISLD
ncbi:hypothetical protein F4703DRAFT_1795382 [Phycomyces blakesleeanus]